MHRMSLALTAVLSCSCAWAQVTKYTIDPAHTYPSFEADHMGISMWRGKLNRTTGSVRLDRAAGRGEIEVVMDLASVDFGLDKMNEWATSDQFFDVVRHPTATYRGRLLEFRDGKPGRVEGTLTLHGVTKPLDLRIHAFKCIPHPLVKRELCGADASASFNRDEFGLAAGKDYGFRMDVALRIQVEALADE